MTLTALVLASICACSSKSPSVTGGDAATSCVYPAAARTRNDASGVGCAPQVPSQSCEIGNGATVAPDGAVVSGTEACASSCSGDAYELVCSSGSAPRDAGGPNTIPSPDTSLDCTEMVATTPSGELFYCCPCGG
jgi:hypothetical protein